MGLFGRSRQLLRQPFRLLSGAAGQQRALNAANKPVDVAYWRRPYSRGPLTEKEFNMFHQEGFVLKPDFFRKEELKPTVESLEAMVELLAQRLYKAGKITDLCRESGFYQRLTRLEKQFPGACVLLHKHGVLPKAIQDLWTTDRLLDVAQQILGPDIAGHPVWNVRPKIPENDQTTVPWHQDSAYLDPVAWNVLQLTAWIPLIDANLQNGCMQVMRRGHQTGKTAQHTCCSGNTWYVELSTEEMRKSLGIDIEKDIVTCEVPFGSVLFLNNLIPHRSLHNLSPNIRWSLDLRWQKVSLPNGFYGLKECVPMTDRKNINWKHFAEQARDELQQQHVQQAAQPKPEPREDAFDTTISGPWMMQWPVVHHNKHSQALLPNASSWHKS